MMFRKTYPLQVELNGLLDNLLGFEVTVSRVFTVTMQINSHGKGLSYQSKNVKTSSSEGVQVPNYRCLTPDRADPR